MKITDFTREQFKEATEKAIVASMSDEVFDSEIRNDIWKYAASEAVTATCLSDGVMKIALSFVGGIRLGLALAESATVSKSDVAELERMMNLKPKRKRSAK